MPLPEDETRPSNITVMVMVASFCLHLLSLALPLALLQTYDRLLPNKAYATTFVLAIGVTVAILFEASLRYGRAVLFAQVGAVFESRMTVRLLDRLLCADGRNVNALGAPALLDAVKAVGRVRDYWSGNAAVALHELPFVVIYIALIAYIGGWLALIPLLLTIAALLVAWWIARVTRDVAHDVNVTETRLRSLIWGIFDAIVEVKAMAAEVDMTRRYRDLMSQSMSAHARQETAMGFIRENGMLLGQLSTIAIVTAGAFLVIDGELTIGGLAACTMLAGRSINPAMSAFVYLNRLADRQEAEGKLDSVLSLPLAPLWNGNGARKFEGGAITVSGEVVEGGTMQIPSGSVVHVQAADALTATAVLATIARLDDALDLTVSFCGESGTVFDSRSLRQHIAVVSGTTSLIRGTLLDNLTLFSPQYDADAMRLSHLLGLDAFVDSLPQGFMTPVGQIGADIVSQGTGVRIGLIRALVRGPSILCLDNVGASLDMDGMRRLMDVLQKLKTHLTIFLVSNNPMLLQLVDQTLHIKERIDG